MALKQYFEKEKSPRRGLMALEWVVVAYTVFTLLIVLFCRTSVENPDAMVWGRVRIMAVTLGMWVVYRLVPCRATRLLRVMVQMLLLSWWYADTYSINCLFPNRDHIVASWDQRLFGCQPSLLFAERLPQVVVSEALDIAYASYFPIIMTVCLFHFFARYKDFERCCFVIMASFFSFYVIFDLYPVTGPMYYFHAIGVDKATAGVFPCVGDYFRTHLEMMTPPGYTDGLGYSLIGDIHLGERPTGAFPSSHVGITTVCMLLAARTRNKTLFFILLPFALLIIPATVYIRAHYAIDAIIGLPTGVLFYCLYSAIARKIQP